MEIGKLNRRITVTPSGTIAYNGDSGGTARTPGTPFDTYCSAKQLSMKEVLQIGLQRGESAYMFGFRYEIAEDITQAYSLTYESRTFHVVGVNEIDENKRQVMITAHERTN